MLEVPGHTAGHFAGSGWTGEGPIVFCGDTLFTGGCGRLFDGTPAQMVDSLFELAALPAETRVVCGLEYTLANLRFAQAVEPANALLRRRQAGRAGEARSGRADRAVDNRRGTRDESEICA